MSLAFDQSWLLLLCLLAVPALRAGNAAWQPFPSLIDVPRDAAGVSIDALLRLLAAAAIIATVMGLAGLHRSRHSIERHGSGAHIVLVLDRSLSMDEGFARIGQKSTETKSAAAARLIDAFFASRPQDSFGIVAFSTAPIQVLPMTDDRAAVTAALHAMRQKALANTDIGGGLRAALAMFAHDDASATRVILLVSDGAGYIEEATQDAIRAESLRERVHLYYLYLRAGDEPPLLEEATTDATHPAALDAFFRSLRVPYRGFEAANARSVQRATDAIGALETRPLVWRETVGRLDYAWLCYAIAAACLAPLLLARAAERPLGGVRQLQGGIVQ